MNRKFKATLHACYFGYITQAIVVNLAPLFFVIFQDSFSISFEMIGRLVLINFGAQLVVDLLAVYFVDRIGYRLSGILAHGFAVAGLVALGILPRIMPDPYTGLVLAVLLYAVGGGLLEVIISPIVDSIPGDAKSAAMSLLHSFYCWGQVAVVAITTLLLRIIGDSMWYMLPILWAILPLYNLFRFCKVPLLSTVEAHEKTPLRKLFTSGHFLVAMVLMMCAGASEQVMSQWASLFAEKGLQVPKVLGDLLGPCFFALCMGIGRTVYGVWGQKLDLKKALIASSILCMICYLVASLAREPVVALLGCALCGLSVSLMWPGMLSLTAATYPKGGTAMFGIMALMGDLGCSVGPWFAGLISDFVRSSQAILSKPWFTGLNIDQAGLKAGILLAIVFPVLMLAGVLLLKRSKGAPE